MARIAIIHDVEKTLEDGTILRWAYARRSLALQKYAPDDFHVDRFSDEEWKWDRAPFYDLLFFLDYTSVVGRYYRHFPRFDVPVVTSFNKDANSRQEYWRRTCEVSDWVIVNNLHRYTHDGIAPNSCCIANGVDFEDWYTMTDPGVRPSRVIWAGSTAAAKRKNHHQILVPLKGLLERQGWECDFRAINDIASDVVYDTQRQREWYNSAAIYVNASDTEGTPSSALEAMACGCVYVSSPVGNVLEFGMDGINCRVVPDKFVSSYAGIIREAYSDRTFLANNGMQTMRRWSYGEPGYREKWFYALFRKIINHGVKSVRPFCYIDTHYTDV